MFSKVIAVAALGAASVSALSLSEPAASAVVQCAIIKFTWSAGQAPYEIGVWPGCDADSTTTDPYSSTTLNQTYAYWTVNEAAGKSIMFGVTDATGDFTWTDDYTVESSNDASCVGVRPSWSSTNGIQTTTSSTVSTSSTLALNTTSVAVSTSVSSSSSVPPAFSTGSVTPTTTAGINNAGLSPVTTISEVSDPSTTATLGAGGSLGGALSNYAPRVEMAALVVFGSSIAALLF